MLLLVTERQHGRIFRWSAKTGSGQGRYEQTTKVAGAWRRSRISSLHRREVSVYIVVVVDNNNNPLYYG